MKFISIIKKSPSFASLMKLLRTTMFLMEMLEMMNKLASLEIRMSNSKQNWLQEP